MDKEYFVLYTPEEMNKAYSLMESDFSRDEIFDALKSDDDIKKQIALIKLDRVNSKEEARLLTSLLTGQHGPVREICSVKINDFIKNKNCQEYFEGEEIREIFLNALNDIIPTVARNILEVIKFLPSQNIVQNALLDRIIALDTYIEDTEKLSNHEIIKKTFRLYWYLEALAEFASDIENSDKLAKIVEANYNHEDYTIREKVSKILSGVHNFTEYKEILKNDTNPYVSEILRKNVI